MGNVLVFLVVVGGLYGAFQLFRDAARWMEGGRWSKDRDNDGGFW